MLPEKWQLYIDSNETINKLKQTDIICSKGYNYGLYGFYSTVFNTGIGKCNPEPGYTTILWDEFEQYFIKKEYIPLIFN